MNSSFNIVHNEESDTDVKLEYQNVPSSSQVQLKKQKSLGGEIFTSEYKGYSYPILFWIKLIITFVWIVNVYVGAYLIKSLYFKHKTWALPT